MKNNLIELKTIDKANYADVMKISVHEKQKSFIMPINKALLKAAEDTENIFAFAICFHNAVIGFAMIRYNKEYNNFFVWEVVIDKQHQNKGYGKAAAHKIIEWVKDRNISNEIVTTVIAENAVSLQLFRSIGFKEMPSDYDDEIDLIYILNDNQQKHMAQKQLIEYYKKDPCRFHSCAIWKTLNKENIRIDILNDNEVLKEISLYDDENMYFYWNRNEDIVCDIGKYNMAILHHTQIENEYAHADKYFRLIYSGVIPPVQQSKYKISEVNVSRETKCIAEFIDKCYEDIKISEEDVASWMNRSVYDESLWILIKDSETKKKIGLGIAEYDKRTGEGSLEWVQVLPEYTGKGVGKLIVTKLCSRMKKADFITVSGKAENIAAEKLYRSCGFVGNDIWYVISGGDIK